MSVQAIENSENASATVHNSKRKGVDPLDKDDDNNSSKQCKVELKHLYAEPKFCSDFNVIYDGVCFHLHRCILARESMYFKNLLEEKTVDSSQIEIPSQNDYEGALSAALIGQFFECLYETEPLQLEDFRTPLSEPIPIYELPSLMYFSHYFQAERLEKRLQIIIVEVIKKNPTESFELLYTAIIYHYQAAKEQLIQKVATNLQGLRSSKTYNPKYWDLLGSTVREQILEACCASRV